jgi:hypothetical protein
LAVLYLDKYGSLAGAKSAGGPWAVEGDRWGRSAFSLRQVQSQIDVVKLRDSHGTIEFPTGRAFRYKRESIGILGILRGKAKWVIFDVSSYPLISIGENSKIVEIEQRAYSMPELPFLVLLGGYLMIHETDYSSDD